MADEKQKRLTKKQKQVLWQAIIDHLWYKNFKQEMLNGRGLYFIPYKNPTMGIPVRNDAR